ncbi:MAG: hypothetical protein K9G46_07210 [Flavobacteriales bacterium]|jgi:hypothetical protein|nr:hypothetical protein [Flavobacteriales bacterium]
MRNLTIATKGDKMILTLNRKGFDPNYIIALIKRLKLEELAQRSGFSDSVSAIAEDLDQQWWDENAESFLKDVKK